MSRASSITFNALKRCLSSPSCQNPARVRGSHKRHFSTFEDQLSNSPTELHLPVTHLTEEERMIQESVRAWSNKELKPIVRQMDQQEQISPDIIRQLFDHGFMSLEVPEKYSGSAFNFTSACITVQEISRIDPSVALFVDIHNTLVVNAIRFWASSNLQQKYLPKLATDTIAAFCLSEPNAGSDAFSMVTTATPSPTSNSDPSYYTINGSKAWISSAREAGLFLVFANVDKDKGYKGITAFLVEADSPGITIGKPESKLGLKASSTCSVHFDDVKVDADHVLGKVGEGYKYCIDILNEGRIGIAAQQIGIAMGCLDIVMPYLHERTQFGQKLAHMPVMQAQFAQAATELHAAQVMMYNACRLKECGMPFIQEASMVKLYSSQVSEKISSKSIEWMGGIGFTSEMMVEKFYRDCKVGSIYEGTSNMQLKTIANIMNAQYE